MPQTITVAGDHLTLALILYRRDGRRGQELVEAAYALNPGLAAHGAILPLGVTVILPERPTQSRPLVRQPVSLFD